MSAAEVWALSEHAVELVVRYDALPWWAWLRRGQARGSDVWYLSQSERDERDAKEFIRDCARFARAFNYGFIECNDAPALADEDGSILVTAIKFASGHRITILPGKNPDALRGKSGLVIFDEAALLDIEACREAGDALAMGLAAVGDLLHSADSLAWSYEGRRLNARGIRDSQGRNLANSQEHAEAFRSRMLTLIEQASEPCDQLDLFTSPAR